MRPSFVRLVLGSVVAFWAAGFAVGILYVRSRDWTEEDARQDGVFLVHQLLAAEPPERRAQRLLELRPNFAIEFSLLPVAEVEARTGRSVESGGPFHHKFSEREEWYFLPFADREVALAAGPVNPGLPRGYLPIGFILAVIGLPLIAGGVALRVERELSEVERANEALARGDLGARVSGSSNELAASFNAMAERVERLVRSRDEVVQAISHELGSPLSRIRFHFELLEQVAGGHEQRLDAIAKELEALDELVTELLGYVQSDDLEPDRTRFEPHRSLCDLAELASLETAIEVEIEVQVELEEHAQVYADPRLFNRAVENVLRNAVRYARAKVNLELTREADTVRVAVHDDGPGIPEEMRERVKLPFFRLEVDRGRTRGGTGLGLAIVHRILEQHGGTLEIASSASLGGALVITSWPTCPPSAS